MRTNPREYLDMGISIIPILPYSKEPYFARLVQAGWQNNGVATWLPATQRLPTEAELDILFPPEVPTSIALVGGEVSGKLVYLDFDNLELARQWARSVPGYVNRTAIVTTLRGIHIYFRVEKMYNGHLYWRTAEGVVVHCGDIKGEGGYVLCPYSSHPDDHSFVYDWRRHPREGILKIESLEDVGLYIPRHSGRPQVLETKAVAVTDRAIKLAISQSANREYAAKLWHGKWRELGFPSQSEADIALCGLLAFWTGRDPGRIDRLFRETRLFRDKWDSMRGDSTYGQQTIMHACANTENVWKPRGTGYKWKRVKYD